MKRPSRSFVVEVRRQRRPPGDPAPSWTEELQRPQTTAAGRSFEPPQRPPAAAATASAPARPAGRILPSLIEAAPVEGPAPEKPPKPVKARIQRRRPHKPPPRPDRAPEPLVVVAPPPVAELTAEEAEAAEAGRAARHRRILARYVFSGGLKPGERWKRRVRGGGP